MADRKETVLEPRAVKAMVELLRRPTKPFEWRPPDHTYAPLLKSLPYFQHKQDGYVHRVRSGRLHFWSGKYKHTSFDFWCGGTGFYSHKHFSRLLAKPSETSVVCATCEGRAIGTGLFGTPTIAGQLVRFSPRCARA